MTVLGILRSIYIYMNLLESINRLDSRLSNRYFRMQVTTLSQSCSIMKEGQRGA